MGNNLGACACCRDDKGDKVKKESNAPAPLKNQTNPSESTSANEKVKVSKTPSDKKNNPANKGIPSFDEELNKSEKMTLSVPLIPQLNEIRG